MEYNHISDEMQVVLGGKSRVYVWWKAEERWNTQCLGLYGCRNGGVPVCLMFCDVFVKTGLVQSQM
jgi:hypothetical protein